MKILTFDTSLNKTYVTLSDNNVFLYNQIIENHDEKYHSAYLMPAVVDLLKSNNLSMQDIDVIGTNIGPGSFTGIRACVTVARVMAQQLNIPLVGVSSLEILSQINNQNGRTIVVMDARKQQFYFAVYDKGNVVVEPSLVSAEYVKDFDYKDAFVISDDVANNYLSTFGVESIVYTNCDCNLGEYLNLLVSEKIKNASNDEYLWGKLKPLYLQTPPVTLSKKPV